MNTKSLRILHIELRKLVELLDLEGFSDISKLLEPAHYAMLEKMSTTPTESVEYDDFMFIGGRQHGRLISLRLDDAGGEPSLYPDDYGASYFLTRFKDGSRAYVAAGVPWQVAEQYLTQYRTTGEIKPFV